MIAAAVGFLVLLNPFALFIYLQPVMRELGMANFKKVLARASLISFVIFFFFSFAGQFIFEKVLQIDFEAFRIFGGIILFAFAFVFIVQGKESLITLKENLNDMASEIALPFMVGAGTILLSIIISHKFLIAKTFMLLAVIMAINYACIIALIYIRNALRAKMQVAFDKVMEMLLRLNGFFMGAIGVNMVVTGINNLYLS